MKTVYIPKTGSEYPAVAKMFAGRGWTVVHEPGCHKDFDIVDLLCLTGGCDVSPHLYGEENISSHCDPKRDEIEQEIYDYCKDQMPMVGICRGGQFLNVMNGGKMIQHIPGHSMGHHRLYGFLEGGARIVVLAESVHGDHHQAMVAPSREFVQAISDDDVQEIVWYPDTKCLCFQPHPEWGHQPTEDLFFQLIEEYIHG